MLQAIRELYAYTRWADERILAAATALPSAELDRDLGGSFGGVLGTMTHVMWADWVWLERWKGASPGGPPDDVATLDEVRARWTAIRDERDEFLRALDEEALERVIAYRNTRGEAFEGVLWRLLLHAVNHATYHRGQILTYLRQLGRPGVATDLVAWQRQVAAGDLPG
jgi:uncharacterized damage-inducible protein DinB